MVEEDWKDKARREKEELERKFREEKVSQQFELPPEPTFSRLVADMAANALIALGENENPLTGRKEVNLPQAKYVIDILAMLKEKTEGNLSNEESSLLNSLLTDLRLRFVKTRERLLKEAGL